MSPALCPAHVGARAKAPTETRDPTSGLGSRSKARQRRYCDTKKNKNRS